MPRSATDATRFTATGPHATSKPTAGSSIPIGAGAPPNETPQQKIARLRAAAAAAKRGQESQFDKLVRSGRVWADRAHRITAWSLIGLTVVCGVFATFSIGDMLIYNRRKRNEWLKEQQEKHARLLEEARTAAAKGQANVDQILLLNQERAAEEAEAEWRAKKGIFTRVKESFISSAPKEEQQGGRIMAEVRAAQQRPRTLPAADAPLSGFLNDIPNPAGVGTASNRPPVVATGPLDQQAEATINAVSTTSKSWFGWITGR